MPLTQFACGWKPDGAKIAPKVSRHRNRPASACLTDLPGQASAAIGIALYHPFEMEGIAVGGIVVRPQHRIEPAAGAAPLPSRVILETTGTSGDRPASITPRPAHRSSETIRCAKTDIAVGRAVVQAQAEIDVKL